MALIIEDGSNVAGANSYATVAELRDYALLRGIVLPVDDAEVEAMSFKAMDYFESFETSFKGERTYPTDIDLIPQVLCWPRTDVTINGIDIEPDAIPIEVKNSQCTLVMQVHAGVILFPTLSPSQSNIKREKVSVIETEYFGYGGTSGVGIMPNMPAVEAVMAPLLRSSGFMGAALRTVRI